MTQLRPLAPWERLLFRALGGGESIKGALILPLAVSAGVSYLGIELSPALPDALKGDLFLIWWLCVPLLVSGIWILVQMRRWKARSQIPPR